jgi:hypothetical protein
VIDKDTIHFSSDSEIGKDADEIKKMKVQNGWIGHLLGVIENPLTRICGMLISSLLIGGILILFIPSRIDPVDFWKIASQLIIPTLTYLFGKNSKT